MPIAAVEMPSGVWLALVALCAVAVTVVELRRWQFRRVSLREVTRAERAALREQREVQQQTAALLAELEAAAERVSRLVDEKIVKLHAELRAADCTAQRPDRLRSATRSPTPAVAPGAPETSRADCVAETPERAGPCAAAEAAVPRAAARRLDELAPRDPRLDRVLELAASGRRSMQIAEALSMPLGEVELILNLHRLETGGWAARGER